jgi:cell wall assembly regulator SMI1
MNDLFDETINIWKNTDVKLQLGASLENISELEIKLDFVFPKDFKELYQKVNGFEDCD